MESKEKILDAALQVFLTKGFERTSMNDIVNESKFTKGAIYHYFSSKENIFAEAMKRLFSEMENWYESVFKGLKSSKKIIQTHFTAIGDMKGFLNNISHTQDIAEFNYYTLMLDAMIKLPGFKDIYQDNHKTYLKSFAGLIRSEQEKGIIRKDIGPGVLAFMIHALLEGSFLYSVMDEEIDLSVLGPGMFKLFWKVISKENEQ